VSSAAAASPLTTDAYRERVSRDLQQFGTMTTERVRCEWLESRLTYLPGAFDDPDTYDRLRDTLAAAALADGGRPANTLFYLATPPSLFGPIVEHLSAAGLLAETRGGAASSSRSRSGTTSSLPERCTDNSRDR
jgi:glucose-6-phosphate 1-dehydrogenase